MLVTGEICLKEFSWWNHSRAHLANKRMFLWKDSLHVGPLLVVVWVRRWRARTLGVEIASAKCEWARRATKAKSTAKNCVFFCLNFHSFVLRTLNNSTSEKTKKFMNFDVCWVLLCHSWWIAMNKKASKKWMRFWGMRNEGANRKTLKTDVLSFCLMCGENF